SAETGKAYSDLLQKEAKAAAGLGDIKSALDISNRALKVARQVVTGELAARNRGVAGALEFGGGDLLVTDHFQGASATAEEAHALSPDDVVIDATRADSYLALGRFESAKKIYLRYKDLNTGDDTFNHSIIQGDFQAMRRYGIEAQGMTEIETLLK